MKKYIAYVDGSAIYNPGPGAAAVIIYNQSMEELERKVKLFNNTTNNRMELEAVLLIPKKYHDESITIFSDSKYVVDGYSDWSKSWHYSIKDKSYINKSNRCIMNSDLWKQLLILKELDIKWIKAHSNNQYNNQVDQLARSAAQSIL